MKDMESKIAQSTKKYSYVEYKALVFNLKDNGGTTGSDQSDERINATKLNAQRIKRLDKTISINETLCFEIKNLNRKWKWTVLLESWCGDGAQNIPIIAKMATLNNNIQLEIILRDENLEIMDQYLTNGSRSIPVLICTDEITKQEIGVWGSRPKKIARLAREYKSINPNLPHQEFLKYLHLTYANDKSESLQNDFLELLKCWKDKSTPC
jgi:hypothetical protein